MGSKNLFLEPTYNQSLNGVEFNITEYSETYGSATMNTGTMKYNFEKVEKTRDRVIFHGEERVHGGKTFSDRAVFGKGNIKVVEDEYKFVEYIQIKEVFVGRGTIYKPTAPFATCTQSSDCWHCLFGILSQRHN